MQNLPGAFNALIEKCCEHHEIEYVLIDLNPGVCKIKLYSDGGHHFTVRNYILVEIVSI